MAEPQVGRNTSPTGVGFDGRQASPGSSMNPGAGDDSGVPSPVDLGSSPVAGDDDILEPVTPEGLAEYTAERYPQLLPLLSIPEIANIMVLAQQKGWGPPEFKAAFIQTEWFKNHSDTYREAWKLQINDPATWAQEVEGRWIETRNLVSQAGLRIDDDVALLAAENSLLYGWSEPEMLNYIANQAISSQGFQAGDLTEMSQGVSETARAFHVNLDENTANQMALDIWSGRLSEDAANSLFRERARERYTWMGDWLDQGGSVESYFNPLKQEVARELEISADSIDLMDTEWMDLVEVWDGTDKERRGRTLTEAIQWARQRPEYENTNGYATKSQGVASMLGELFGRAY